MHIQKNNLDTTNHLLHRSQQTDQTNKSNRYISSTNSDSDNDLINERVYCYCGVLSRTVTVVTEVAVVLIPFVAGVVVTKALALYG